MFTDNDFVNCGLGDPAPVDPLTKNKSLDVADITDQEFANCGLSRDREDPILSAVKSLGSGESRARLAKAARALDPDMLRDAVRIAERNNFTRLLPTLRRMAQDAGI